MAFTRALAFVGGSLPALHRVVASPSALSAGRSLAARRGAPGLAGARPAAGARMASGLPPSPPPSSTAAVARPSPSPVTTSSSSPGAAAASTVGVVPDEPPTWKVKLLFDGECPLCVREVNFLKKKDAGRGLVSFVDIADPSYDPAANAGLDYATAMGRIHAIEADGTVVQDVRVFRRVYEELGMGWVYAATKVPAVEAAANQVYGVWARARLALTGRGSMEEVMAARGECEDSCKI